MNEEVSRDMTGAADGVNQGVGSRDGVMRIFMSQLSPPHGTNRKKLKKNALKINREA